MQRYVAGFLTDGERVLLVRKSHPPALAGRLNAVGGKVETGETDAEAMEREFYEETTFRVPGWQEYCRLHGSGHAVVAGDFEVVFFIKLVSSFSSFQFCGTNDAGEPLFLVEIKRLPWLACLPNVQWLLAMGLSIGAGERAAGFTVTERY